MADWCRHIQSCKVLVFVIDASAETSQNGGVDEHQCQNSAESALLQLEQLHNEISAFDSNILTKPSLIVLNKMDCLTGSAENFISRFKQEAYKQGLFNPILLTSALTRQGIQYLIDLLKITCQEFCGTSVRNAETRSR